MSKYKLVALSLAGGLLSALAWTSWCTGLILLISFIPFLVIGNHLFENRKNYTSNAYFLYLLPGFVIFNILSIGWVRVATMTGAITIIMGLSFMMSFTLWLAYIIRTKAGNLAGIISVFAFYLGYEFLTLKINIFTPWLNLGNGFSKDIAFIQWYDHTGTAGGTLWILASNFLLTAFILKKKKREKNNSYYLVLWFLLIILPSGISIKRYYSISKNNAQPEEVVIVQPNIDPYEDKFRIPFIIQLNKALSMAEEAVNPDTKWIITPETTVDDPLDLGQLNDNVYITTLQKFVVKNPTASIVTGMVTYKTYPITEKVPSASAVIKDSTGNYYDHFNSALKIDTGQVIEVYHKSKLVPGIEMQFDYNPAKLFRKILPDLGGTIWGYGIQKERKCFTNQVTRTKIAPIICYESIFGEFVTGYVRKGANALFIITNDGWWKNTSGYKQHLWYASLRAIETRRPVVRSANTGISCITGITGKRIKETRWWEEAVLKGEIIPETNITPYVKYGDYLLRIGALISVFILVMTFMAIPFSKKLKSL
jgi:apolipoprotein N-acyltransferase